MTGRHAGPLHVSDTWLIDQWAAWARDVDAYFDQYSEVQLRSHEWRSEDFWAEFQAQSARKSVLLCTARLLAAESIRAAEISAEARVDRIFDLGGDNA